MTKFIIRVAINAVGLYAAVWLIPGIDYLGDWTGILWLALIIGLLNALVRPLLKFLTCPLIILTLGLGTLLINTLLFWLTGVIGNQFQAGFSVDGFWPAFWGALIVSLVSFVLTLLLHDELKRDRNRPRRRES